MKFKVVWLVFIVINIFLFIDFAKAQAPVNNYNTQWKNVDELVKKGLTKSALEKVNKIYNTAKKAGNGVQVIKSLLYQLNLNQNIREDADIKNIEAVEKETEITKEPAKSILYSISAEMYWSFFQQNMYKIYSRTNTTNFTKADIQTWTADDFHKEIGELYLSSIKEEKLLQQTTLDQ